MRLFTCSACGQSLFFENVACTQCGRTLAYLPDCGVLSALEPAADGEAGVFVALAPEAGGGRYRLCGNYVDYAACNWALPAADGPGLCRACRFNTVIPNLADPQAAEAWRQMERAKRRLVYSLMRLGLPLESKTERPEGGLAFAFEQDQGGGEAPVSTGHNDGLITINLAEADDPFREKTRLQLGETYRTLLGHFRHEVAHYYWDRLIKDTAELGPFRSRFGDERADYAEAMQRHYRDGAPADWQNRFVSAYASMHPWEDWAETWAHYLHMVDTLETAQSYGIAVSAAPAAGDRTLIATRRLDFTDFDGLLHGWLPLVFALNSLNRSMGLRDPYPFVLSEQAIAKLRFVHDVIARAALGQPPGD